MRARLVCLALGFAALTAACFGGDDPNLAPSGRGLPVVDIAFPEVASAGSLEDAVLTVENPGPGDIRFLSVTFALVGPRQGQREFPVPIVGPGDPDDHPDVEGVSPEPRAVSGDGVVYNFGPLAEGEETTITFSLRLPEETGPAANSVQVGDGQELERARGVRLETMVRR